MRQKHRRLGGSILKCARRYQTAPRGQPSIAAKPQHAKHLVPPISDGIQQGRNEAANDRDTSGSSERLCGSAVTGRHRQQHPQRSAASSIDRRHVSAEQLEAGRHDHLTLTRTLHDKSALHSPPSTIVYAQQNHEDMWPLALAASPGRLTQHRDPPGRGHIAVSSDPLNVPLEKSRRLDPGRTLSTASRSSLSHLSAFSFPSPYPQVRKSQEAPPRSTSARPDAPSPNRPRAGTLAYGALRGRRAFDLVRSGLPLQHPSACPPLHRQPALNNDLPPLDSWPTHERQQHCGLYEHRIPSGSLSRAAQPQSLSPSGRQSLSRRRDSELVSGGREQPIRSYGAFTSRSAWTSLPSIRGVTSAVRRRSDISEHLIRPILPPMETSDRSQSAHLPHGSSPFSSMSIPARQSSDSRLYHYRGDSISSALSGSSLTSGMHTVESSLGSFASPTLHSPGEDQSTCDAPTREDSLAQRALDMEELQHALSHVPEPIEIELGSAHKAAAAAYGHRRGSSSYRPPKGTDKCPSHGRSPFGSVSGLVEANRMRRNERGQVDSPCSFPARSPSLSPPHHSAYEGRSRSMSLLSLEEEDALTLPPILSLLVNAGEEEQTAAKPWQAFGEQKGEEGGGGHAAQVCKLPGIAHLISPRSL